MGMGVVLLGIGLSARCRSVGRLGWRAERGWKGSDCDGGYWLPRGPSTAAGAMKLRLPTLRMTGIGGGSVLLVAERRDVCLRDVGLSGLGLSFERAKLIGGSEGGAGLERVGWLRRVLASSGSFDCGRRDEAAPAYAQDDGNWGRERTRERLGSVLLVAEKGDVGGPRVWDGWVDVCG